MQSDAALATRCTSSASTLPLPSFLRTTGLNRSFATSRRTQGQGRTAGCQLALRDCTSSSLAASTERLTGSMPSSLNDPSGGRGAPTLRIRFTRDPGVRYRAHDGANLSLLVAFHGCLLRTAAGFSPDDFDFGSDLDIRVHDSER